MDMNKWRVKAGNVCCGRKGFPETSFVSICDMLCCVKNPSSVAHNKHCTLLYMHASIRPSEFRFITFFSCYDKSKVHFFKWILCSLTFGDTLTQEEGFVLKTLNINGVQKLFATTEQKKKKKTFMKAILYVSENNTLNGTLHNKITFLPRKRSRRPQLANETGHLFAEASEVPDYDRIIHKTQRADGHMISSRRQSRTEASGEAKGGSLGETFGMWKVQIWCPPPPGVRKTQKKRGEKKKVIQED